MSRIPRMEGRPISGEPNRWQAFWCSMLGRHARSDCYVLAMHDQTKRMLLLCRYCGHRVY